MRELCNKKTESAKNAARSVFLIKRPVLIDVIHGISSAEYGAGT